MSLETDLLLDRRRLQRRLWFWRGVSVVAVVACALIVVGRAGAVAHAHIARLNVTGIITENRKLTDAIYRLTRDDSVKALEVFVDSPGGSVAGGESLHDAIADVAARKPVVTVMGGTAASAGYMVSVPAARIFARGSTLTGSIGVLLESAEASGLLARIGITPETIVSGPLKDQPSFTKPLSPQGHEVLQGLVMDMYDQFVAMVVAGRHMTTEQVRSLADGRAYTGRQALQLGLVDQIGGEAEARAWLARERGVPAGTPIEDLQLGSLAERTFGSALTDITDSLLKIVLFQGLTLDGAWALWQHPQTGE
jgi:protease-4